MIFRFQPLVFGSVSDLIGYLDIPPTQESCLVNLEINWIYIYIYPPAPRMSVSNQASYIYSEGIPTETFNLQLLLDGG